MRKDELKELQRRWRVIEEAENFLEKHVLFGPIFSRIQVVRGYQSEGRGWATVSINGLIEVDDMRKARKEEWIYILAHQALHLGMGHFSRKGLANSEVWNTACDLVVGRFLDQLQIGKAPNGLEYDRSFPAWDEEKWLRQFQRDGIASSYRGFGTGNGPLDMRWKEPPMKYRYYGSQPIPFEDLFARGLARAATQAVRTAAGFGDVPDRKSEAEEAKSWFLSHYPLLGSLAASFRIIEDQEICRTEEISIAAVNVMTKEIYINPAANLSVEELKFVMAHELLHVGLCHSARRKGRDPYLWNIACDYVINAWLIEMGVGTFPEVGGLYDPELKGISAESLYDRIAVDLRHYRKLATFRGHAKSDMIEPDPPDFWSSSPGMTLDEFYRRALSQGLTYHQEGARGFLPAGLVEEIRALHQPPIPWDVELANWLDGFFRPIEKQRTYARANRRQAATPNIARPAWYIPEEETKERTFGVILDTSGSMGRVELGKALGAIASYSLSRVVGAVRVIYCDAVAYDAGYIRPEALLERVEVRGRGGTVLQPAVNLLENAPDFPKKGPILIITDGWIDRLKISREHAYVLSKSGRLPFPPKGEVFRME